MHLMYARTLYFSELQYGVMDSRFTRPCNVALHANFCRLLATTSQFSILVDQKMQLTGCHYGSKEPNVACMEKQTSKVQTLVNVFVRTVLYLFATMVEIILVEVVTQWITA